MPPMGNSETDPVVPTGTARSVKKADNWQILYSLHI